MKRSVVALLTLWFLTSAVPLRATNPDLTLAPSPSLSQAAQITVKHGTITDGVANHMSDQAGVTVLRYVLRDQNFEAIINRIL